MAVAKRGTSTARPAKTKAPKAKAQAKKKMSEAAMMAAWQKAMTPGEGHRRLEPLIGSWRAKTTFQWGARGQTHPWQDRVTGDPVIPSVFRKHPKAKSLWMF